MKKWMTILCVLVMTVLAGCGSSANDSNANQEENKDKTVKVGLLRIDDSIPFQVAEQEGMFEKAGINVELVWFSSSSDQSVAMEAGELDMAMNDMIVQGLLKKNNTETKVISYAFGAVPTEGRFVIASAPDSGIIKPEDLLGKNVAISTNTMMDYLMDQFERIYDLDDEQIQKINMPNLMLRTEALIEGKDIDAAILPDPLASYVEASGCHIVIDDTTLGENLSQSVVLATQEMLDQDEETLQLVMQAYNQAIEAINSHPEQYRATCLEVANVPESLHDTYPTPTYTKAAVPSEEEVQRVENWLYERGLVDTLYSYGDIVDDRFAK